MSVNREDLTSLKEDFWKEPEPKVEPIKEQVDETAPAVEETKAEEAAPVVEETATNEEAQEMVESGEAEIPAEAVVSEEDKK